MTLRYFEDVQDLEELVEAKGGKFKGYQQQDRDYVVFYEAKEEILMSVRI